MVKIKEQLVSPHIISERSYGYGNPCKYITIHDTDNKTVGAGAQAHANLQSNKNPRQASWHLQVDDKEIIQSFPFDVMCWSAGDGRGKGNTQSIHIEMCINSDSDYTKTVNNTVELVKHLMDKFNIPIQNVVQHNYWSGKDCPKQMRNGKNGITWKKFKEMIKSNDRGEKKLYRVQVGAFASQENAKEYAKKVEKAGFDTYIVRY